MTVRNINSTLKTYLAENKPYILAHLVKFERPTISDSFSGSIAEKTTDYVYLTDAGRDIQFDDGSFSKQQQYQKDKDDFQGVAVTTASPNGPQLYRANKLTSVGTINEGIEAKASNLSLKIDAGALNLDTYVSATFSGDNISTNIDLSDYGIKEGDKIRVTKNNISADYIINRFTLNSPAGTTPFKMNATRVSGSALSGTNAHLRIQVVSEDISTLVLGSSNVSYTNYINRRVFVYRVYIDPETNTIVGGEPAFYSGTYDSKGAVLLFKGIISSASMGDTPGSKREINWTLTSHWGDFIQVKNRITSDAEHRALTVDGLPDRDVILKQTYASDLGFEHSETSLNLMATYDQMVTKHKLKKKKKNLGLSTKYTLEEYEEAVPTDIDLKLNLHAKALPVVYGVQKVESVPVFFDNQKSKTDHVYAAFAICEGSIGGIYDVILDSKTTICTDAADQASRGTQNANNSVDVLCQGRADLGNVLEGINSSVGTPKFVSNVYDYEGYLSSERDGIVAVENTPYYEQNTQNLNAGSIGVKGILHEKTFAFRDPIDSTFIFHSGLSNQRANNLLVEKAAKQLFKIQNDFYEGQPHKYWTPNHRLLDTAYCVGEFIVGDGEIELPEMTFLVKGRDVECYNYDNSYMHNPASTYSSQIGNIGQFNAGDTVTITGTGISSYSTVIIDKFFFYDTEGTLQWRFRYEIEPSNPTYDIIMTKGSYSWNMLVSDGLVATGTVPQTLAGGITGFSGSGAGFTITCNQTTAAQVAFDTAITQTVAVNGQSEKLAKISLVYYGATHTSFGYSALSFESSTSNTISGLKGLTLDSNDITTSTYNTVWVRNAAIVQLVDAGGSVLKPSDNRLEGHTVIMTHFDTNGKPYVQERVITRWVDDGGATTNAGMIFVDEPWDLEYQPIAGSTYLLQIRTPKDKRVSLNPAMQLLDYMKSERYGKGLASNEVDVESFKSAARQCDSRSDVTVLTPSAGTTIPAPGAKYKLENNSNLQFRGTVKTVVEKTISSTAYFVITFEDCIGKLLTKFTGAQYAVAGDLFWRNDGSVITLKKATINGDLQTTIQYNALTTAATADFTLQKISGTGAGALVMNTGTAGYSADGNPIIKSIDSAGGCTASGYSLYDSDNVKYWKLAGWESPAQRNVTRHQFNQVIDTANNVFSNVNNMLRQFNGVLRYSNGKYQLQVKSSAGTLDALEKIKEEDIIGKISLSDKGSKKTYNSISANIIDPSQNFENRSVSFFNSDYIKEDNNIPKKGTFDTPSITNYYNARVNIKQFLDESRNGLEIQFKVRPSGVLLQAGEIISLEYPNFSWNYEKLWRITNLNFNADGTVSVTAIEHEDSVYLVQAEDRVPQFKIETGSTVALPGIPDAPYGLSATQNASGGIELNWVHTTGFNPSTFDTEVFRNTINARQGTMTTNAAGNNATSMTFASVSGTDPVAVGMTVEGVDTELATSAGSFLAGEVYKITTLGNTPWHTITGIGVLNDYSLGDVVIPVTGQTGAGTTGALQRVSREVKVTAVDIANNTITLNHPADWSNGTTITFKAQKIATIDSESSYIDPIIGDQDGDVTRYYWIRYRIKKPVQNVAGAINKVMFSNFFPTTITGGVLGIGRLIDVEQVRDFNLTFGNAKEFVYNTGGNNIESGFATNCQITVSGINTSGTVTYRYRTLNKTGTQIADSGSVGTNSFTYTAPTGANQAAGFALLPQSVEITMTDTVGSDVFTKTETVDFTATRIILDGNAGLDAMKVVLTNPIHQFPIALSGTITTTGSGTNFQVFEGGTALKQKVAGSVGNGEYSVTLTSTACTPGSLSGQNTTTTTIANHSLLNSTITDGTVVITISGNRLDGTSFSETATQILTVKDLASTVNITVDDQSIEYNNLGLSPSPATVNITVDTFGITTPFIDIVATDSASTPNVTTIVTNQAVSNSTYADTFTVPINLSDTPISIEVIAKEVSGGTTVAKDKATVFGVKNGITSAIVYAYKRAASAPNDNPGACTVSLTTGKITTGSLANSWEKTPPSGTDPMYVVTATAAGGGLTDAVAAGEWTSPEKFVEDGDDGAPGLNVATALIYQRTTTSSAPSTGTNSGKPSGNSTFTFSSGSTSFSTANGWSATIPVGTNGRYLWILRATASSTASTDTIADSEWGTIELLAHDPEDAIVVSLSNPFALVTTNSDNTLDKSGTSSSLSIFEGNTLLTAKASNLTNGTYSVAVTYSSGITPAGATSISNGVFSVPLINTMTVAEGIRTLAITGLRLNGESFTRSITQNIKKSESSESVRLYVPVLGTAVEFPTEGNRPVATGVTVRAEIHGLDTTDNATYTVQFLNGTTNIVNAAYSAGAANATITMPQDYDDYPYLVTGSLRRNGVTITTDTIAFYAIRNGRIGNSTTTGILSNETHSIRKNKNLVANFDNSGTDIEMFEGGLALNHVASNPTAGQFTVSSAGSGGITPGNISTAASSGILIQNPSPVNKLNGSIAEAFEIQDLNDDGVLESWKDAGSSMTVTPNAIAAPFNVQGGSGAELLQGPNSSGVHGLRVINDANTNFSVLNLSNTQHCFSCYLKKGTGDYAYIGVGAVFFAAYAKVNLTNGAVLSNSAASTVVTSVGNGWYRVSLTFTFSTSQLGYSGNSAPNLQIGISDAGGSTYLFNSSAHNKNIYVWGARCEVTSASTPSAYAVNAQSIARVADHGGTLTSLTPSIAYTLNGVGFGGGILPSLVKTQTFSVVNPASTVQVNSSAYSVDFDSAGNNPSPANLTYTPTVFGIGSDKYYKWTINSGGTSVVSYTTHASPAKADGTMTFASFPKVVTCEVYSGTTQGSGVLLASDSFSVIGVKPGATVNITASMGSHIFDADNTGLVAINDYSNTFSVVINDVTFSYDGSSPYSANSYRFGSIANTDANVYASLINTNGTLTVAGNSNLFTAQTSNTSDQIQVPIINNATGITIGVYIISLVKRIGNRIIEPISSTLTTSGNNTTFMASWRGETTLTNAQAVSAAGLAISGSTNSELRPGDTLILDYSLGGSTRIYKGSPRTGSVGTLATEWSSPVVETVPGSMVVNGTLSAAALATNTTLTNTLNVNNRITVGQNSGTSSAAAINSFGKAQFSSTAGGFFLGRDGSDYSFNVGDATNFLKFDGQTGAVAISSTTGDFTLKSGTSGARLEIINNVITIRDTSGNIRVKIGAL